MRWLSGVSLGSSLIIFFSSLFRLSSHGSKKCDCVSKFTSVVRARD